MKEDKVYQINTQEDIDGVKHLKKSDVVKIIISDKIKNHLYFQDNINKQFFACGCNLGGIFLMFGFVVFIFSLIQKHLSSIEISVKYLGIGVLSIFIFSFIGKGIGLLIAQFQLDKYLRNLKNNIF